MSEHFRHFLIRSLEASLIPRLLPDFISPQSRKIDSPCLQDKSGRHQLRSWWSHYEKIQALFENKPSKWNTVTKNVKLPDISVRCLRIPVVDNRYWSIIGSLRYFIKDWTRLIDVWHKLWLVVVRLLWLVIQSRGVLGSNPGKLPIFHFPLLSLYNIKIHLFPEARCSQQ